MKPVKQVVVIRKDLKLRRGKECAQVAHASMAFILKLMVDHFDNSQDYFIRTTEESDFSEAEFRWFATGTRKVVLQIEGLQDLQEIHRRARASGIKAHLITDAGATEFHGVPTVTCLALGPDWDERLDPLTSHLKLY